MKKKKRLPWQLLEMKNLNFKKRDHGNFVGHLSALLRLWPVVTLARYLVDLLVALLEQVCNVHCLFLVFSFFFSSFCVIRPSLVMEIVLVFRANGNVMLLC